VLPLHPRIVHLPVALAVVMPLVTSGLLLAWWRAWLPRRTWVLAVALPLVLVAGGAAAIRSGQAEEHRAETAVAESLIEAHEEAGELTVVGAAVALVVATAVLAIRREGTARAVAAVATAGTLAVVVLAYRAADAGGRLVYVHGAASAYARPALGAPRPAAHDDHD
jgi:uncharacterized membrane protein